ncbi:MAG: MarR family transcriptional regulator [Candidatus Hydrogenedens sp.]|nr:MarR family transcriptional regulator [Candidatus Hydrogenedentota bacterium]NLF57044.1 MarR family transcriptional regulator [Candidatus Hydrogenedens sp.]
MSDTVNHRAEQAREIFSTVEMLRDSIMKRCFCRDAIGEGHPEITFSQMRALHFIKSRGGTTIKQIAEDSDVSPASASAMVDRLVDMGMVVREQDTEDRRAVNVSLSERGRETFKMHERVIMGAIGEILEEIGEEATRQWLFAYRKVREVLERKLSSEAD